MAFKIHTVDDGRDCPFEYLGAKSDLVAEVGLALGVNASGEYIKASTTAPTYIAMGPVKDGLVPAIKVAGDIVFECVTADDMSAITIGKKVPLSSDGLSVTNGNTSTVATVVYMEPCVGGTLVRVRF